MTLQNNWRCRRHLHLPTVIVIVIVIIITVVVVIAIIVIIINVKIYSPASNSSLAAFFWKTLLNSIY